MGHDGRLQNGAGLNSGTESTGSQDLHVTFEKKEAPSQIKKRLGRKNGMDFIIILGLSSKWESQLEDTPKLDVSGYLVIFLHMHLCMYTIINV